MINFDKALEEGKVITACSRKGDLGVLQAKAFGMFFILQFQDAVLRRKGTEDSRTPHFLYIDEFPEYINKDMEVMFTLFRKYRCGVSIALQNLSQLSKGDKSGYYRQTVLANTKLKLYLVIQFQKIVHIGKKLLVKIKFLTNQVHSKLLMVNLLNQQVLK